MILIEDNSSNKLSVKLFNKNTKCSKKLLIVSILNKSVLYSIAKVHVEGTTSNVKLNFDVCVFAGSNSNLFSPIL